MLLAGIGGGASGGFVQDKSARARDLLFYVPSFHLSFLAFRSKSEHFSIPDLSPRPIRPIYEVDPCMCVCIDLKCPHTKFGFYRSVRSRVIVLTDTRTKQEVEVPIMNSWVQKSRNQTLPPQHPTQNIATLPTIPRILTILRIPLRLISILSILIGFTLLSWGVTFEYFEYRTTSIVEIRDYAGKEVAVPTIVMCIRFDINPLIESKIGKLFTGEKNYFHEKDDSWRLINWRARLPEGKNLTSQMKKYFMLGNKYCLFIKVLDRFSMEEVTSPKYMSLTYFYLFNTTMSPIHSKRAFGYYKKACTPKSVYFIIVSGEAAISNPMNRFACRDMCTEGIEHYEVDITYSSSTISRLPPPFDTNCLDYRKSGPFLSSHDCYDKCLKRKTAQWNFVPGMTVIDKELYKNSMADIVPGDIVEGKKLDKLIKNGTLSPKLIESYRVLRNNWKGIKESCKNFCRRSDCVSERITPAISYWGSGPQANGTKLKRSYYRLMLSDQPFLHVASVPRQRLLDYIVYMCSGLSFWLGFCPLKIVDKMDGWVRKTRRKTQIRNRWRSSRLSDSQQWRWHRTHL